MFDHSLQVLNKLDDTSDILSSRNRTRKFKLPRGQSGIELIPKRVKAMKLADKSEFG